MTNQGERERMAAILGLGTALPPHRIEQEEAADRVAEALAPGQAGTARLTRRLFRQCAVETRHACHPQLTDGLSTAERGRLYREHASPLALAAARRALADAGAEAGEITHVLAVSCTGLYLPGLDNELVRGLGLAADTVRMPLYFVGCAAGLRAIGIAKRLTESGAPGARALVVFVELCTQHVQLSQDRSELMAAALFGDGASACVIGAADSAGAVSSMGTFELGACRSAVLPEGEQDMTWIVGDNGYKLHLSPRIPELLGRYLPGELQRLGDDRSRQLSGSLAEESERDARVRFRPGLWAIHPGGRAILDEVQRLFELSGEQLQPSREVLRRCGNMSSATILFVLEELRSVLAAADASSAAQREGIALAFGPGLTAELQQFHYAAPNSRKAGLEEAELCSGAF